MFALLLPLILAGWALVLAAHPTIVQSGLTSLGDASDAQARSFIAASRAALAFTGDNPGYVGGITQQQLTAYMAPYALPASWQGRIQSVAGGGRRLALWAPTSGNTARAVWAGSDGDCAYALAANGALQSPCGQGAIPVGVPEGSLLYEAEVNP